MHLSVLWLNCRRVTLLPQHRLQTGLRFIQCWQGAYHSNRIKLFEAEQVRNTRRLTCGAMATSVQSMLGPPLTHSADSLFGSYSSTPLETILRNDDDGDIIVSRK